MGETFTDELTASIPRPRWHKTFNSAESRAETGTKAHLKFKLSHIVVGNEPVLCDRLKMDQQKTAKGTFVETFTEVGLNGRKVGGRHEEQGALTSSGGLPNVLLKAVTSGAEPSPQAGTDEDTQGLLSQKLVNPAENMHSAAARPEPGPLLMLSRLQMRSRWERQVEVQLGGERKIPVQHEASRADRDSCPFRVCPFGHVSLYSTTTTCCQFPAFL